MVEPFGSRALPSAQVSHSCGRQEPGGASARDDAASRNDRRHRPRRRSRAAIASSIRRTGRSEMCASAPLLGCFMPFKGLLHALFSCHFHVLICRACHRGAGPGRRNRRRLENRFRDRLSRRRDHFAHRRSRSAGRRQCPGLQEPAAGAGPCLAEARGRRIGENDDRRGRDAGRTRPRPRAPDNAIEAKLASLRSEREGWQSTIDALNAKRAMIVRFSQSGPEKLSAEAKPLDVGQWNAAWDTVAVGLAKLGDDLRPALAKARQLDEQIKALEAQRAAPAAGPGRAAKRNRDDQRGGADAWRVSNCPTASATSAGAPPMTRRSTRPPARGRLSLTRRAILAQRTGEDWSDVALVVSTARVARASDIPDVQPLKIDFWQPVQADDQSWRERSTQRRGAERSGHARRADRRRRSRAGVRAKAGSAGQSRGGASRRLQSDAYSAEFNVPGRVSLASDGAQKSFVLAPVSARRANAARQDRARARSDRLSPGPFRRRRRRAPARRARSPCIATAPSSARATSILSRRATASISASAPMTRSKSSARRSTARKTSRPGTTRPRSRRANSRPPSRICTTFRSRFR